MSRRAVLKSLLIASAIGVTGIAVCVVTAPMRERHAHLKQRERVSLWIKRAREAPPPTGVHPLVWSNLLVALDHGLGNPLHSPRAVPTEEIRKMADALDAAQGRQLTSLEGAVAMMDHMEKICPAAVGYSSFENARSWMRDYPGPTRK